jgi:hypothetical protein
MKMRHFIMANRLKWSYLRRLSRAFGAATVGFDAYQVALRANDKSIINLVREKWSWQTLATFRHLLRRPLKLFTAPLAVMEGDAEALRIENLWGRLLELLRHRRSYVGNLRRIRTSMSDKL